MSSSDEMTQNVVECLYHPTLTNWRVVRTLKALKAWSLEHEGYIHPNCRGLRLTLSGGRIHRRTAEAILFDYEKPFIDLLIQEGYLDSAHNFEGVAQVLILNAKSDAFILANQKAEVK